MIDDRQAVPTEDFTREERAVLKVAAEHYLTGRKLACFMFRVTCAVGALAGAAYAIIALWRGVPIPPPPLLGPGVR
jgi:hypothetical protein